MLLLSFASVLGGMTTLIGSSTNLLVSLALASLGERPFGFFDFTIPGLVPAGSGLCYPLLAAPPLLPVRGPPPVVAEAHCRQFLAQPPAPQGSRLVGLTAIGPCSPPLKD